MALKLKVNLIEVLVLVHFPLYGLYSFLRVQEMKILGYLVYILPMVIYISFRLIRAMINADLRLPSYLFHRDNRLHALFFFGLVLVMLNGLIVSAIVGSRESAFAIAEFAMLFTILLFWVLVIESERFKKNGLRKIFAVLIMSLMIYAAMNAISVLAGFESEAHAARFTRQFEAIYNPFGVRVNFPFALSGQHFSILGGILVILSFVGTRYLGFSHIARVCMLGLGAFALIGQSARTSIVALVLVLSYGLIARKMGTILITPLLLIILIVPVGFVYFDVGDYLYQFTEATGVIASRSEGDVASLSNRDVIWEVSLNHIFNDAGLVYQLFGYGAYGQITSGIDSSFTWLFDASYLSLEHPTLHNSYMQVLIDYGITGLILLMGVLLVVLRYLDKAVHSMQVMTPDMTVLLLLLYLSICAITDVIITYYAFDLLSIFLFLNLYVMAQRSSEARLYTLLGSHGEL